MIAAALCVIAFIITLAAARRSTVAGLCAVLVVGYAYGILRANIIQPLSHFIFDASVAALYLAAWRRGMTAAERKRSAPVRNWMFLLVGWPVVLAVLPVQDPLVQLVGLRGNVFLVPLLVIGAMMSSDDMLKIVRWIALLNLFAFVFALLEFRFGIEPFFPRSAVTEIMYNSRDIVTSLGSEYRIPSTFTSAHAYGGAMAFSVALFIGALQASPRPRGRDAVLLVVSLMVSATAVFMAGPRQPVVTLAAVGLGALMLARIRLPYLIGTAVLLAGVAFVIGRSERLQRFRTLEDTEFVSGRVQTSVNENFFQLAADYPMGVGMGAGGTSMPYFLAERVQGAVAMENEYARIMLEQGIPGLLIWVAFLARMLAEGFARGRDPFLLGRRLLWIQSALAFGTGFIGLGLLASIPGSAMLLLSLGFISNWARSGGAARRAAQAEYRPIAAPAGAAP